jgi:creatinine amidohydrolase
MRLQMLTWAEAEAAVAASDAIIMPIGSTEQHGPNGLLGTDAVTAEAMALEIGERCGALVAPVIAVGMAEHHMAFAGSMTLKPATLILVIRDCVLSLAAHGFRRFYFLNGHGGNILTINKAFQEIAAAAGSDDAPDGLNCVLRNWWANPGVKEFSAARYGDQEGYHATPSEVAVTQYLFPDFIKRVEMPAAAIQKPQIGSAAEFRARYPDGRMNSNPALAAPEDGKLIFEAAVAHWAEDFRVFAQ